MTRQATRARGIEARLFPRGVMRPVLDMSIDELATLARVCIELMVLKLNGKIKP